MRGRFGSETRIRKRSEYERVRCDGLFRHGSGFLLQAAVRIDGDACHRVGVIASKRAVGNAVARNRAKRVFRALFRETDFGEGPPVDWVVLVKRGYQEQDHESLRGDWDRAVSWLRKRLGGAGE